jgi:hypothetical protein
VQVPVQQFTVSNLQFNAARFPLTLITHLEDIPYSHSSPCRINRCSSAFKRLQQFERRPKRHSVGRNHGCRCQCCSIGGGGVAIGEVSAICALPQSIAASTGVGAAASVIGKQVKEYRLTETQKGAISGVEV